MRTLAKAVAVAALTAGATLAWGQDAMATPPLTYKLQDAALIPSAEGPSGNSWSLVLALQGSTAKADADRLKHCLDQSNVIEFTQSRVASEGIADAGVVAAPLKLLAVVGTRGTGSANLSVLVRVQAPDRSRGIMKFHAANAPDACSGISLSGPDGPPALDIFTDDSVSKSSQREWKARFQGGAGTRGASLEFDVSRELAGLSRNKAEEFTLDASGKIPLGRPKDVRDLPGASKDASKDVADVLNLSMNHIQYSKGGKLDRKGLRVRGTGSLRGAEVTGYWSPLFGWFHDSHGFYGAEVEAGWRKGDAEFTTLVTRKPDIGHTVARIGAVAEWAPRMCLGEGKCINSNLSQGLRFFVRGRLWVDSYKEQGAGTRWRARPFIDSELFYNFTKDDRVFLRAESGYLPPDLSTRSKRVYVGVGKAF